MAIPFYKFQGFGNDYIVIEKSHIPPDADISQLAIDICDRHRGAGSDGIAVISPISGNADHECEIVNPDGSIAGFSGNGTRCAVAYLFHQGAWKEPLLRLKTRSGIKRYTFLEKKGDGEYWFDAEIGGPRFVSDQVPVNVIPVREAVVNHPIYIDGERYDFSAVSVGNPVACVFVDNFDFDWRSVGKKMEIDPIFPARANIVFVKVIDRENIELRIWERAAGETSASGTCSSGAAVLSAFLLKTKREVDVHSPGGVTSIFWRDDNEIVITGRADFAYNGVWPWV